MKTTDKMLLIIWVIVPPILLYFLPSNFFISIIFYLILPSIYFSIQVPKIIHKALIVAFASIPFVIIFDYLAFLNKTWAVPTIFPFRLLHFIPVEDFFFTFCAVYVVVTAYYYFFKERNYTKINITRLHYSLVFIMMSIILFFLAYAYLPNLLIIPYYYCWLDILAFIIPIIILYKFFPHYHKHLWWIILYLLVLMLPYEIIADTLGYWSFPANQYIGQLHLLNQHFPIEEFFAWMILFAPASLAFTEFIEGTEHPIKA